jgi:2'-5' RNA ligase
MRLFVAVDIDEGTRAQLAPAREAVQRVVIEARVPPRITWTKDDSAHVTVRFIGEVPEHAAQAIVEALSAGLDVPPFETCWDRPGSFGGRIPRVIWVAPSSGLEAFARLAANVDARLEPLVGPGQSRPFKPHLTLGRVRDPGRAVDWTRALAAIRFEPAPTRVDHVTLYQSRLSPKGSTYTALCKVGL